MIVDVHGHLGPWFFSMEVGPPETNVELLDRYGIDCQLVSSTEAVVYDAPRGNRALAEALRDQPRLRGLLVVDPRHLDAARKDLHELLPSGRFVGAKIHTAYTATRVIAPAMRDAFTLLAEYGLPTLVHTWDDVVELARVVACVPRLRVVAGHMGGPGWRAVPEAAEACDRVWFEPCYSIADAGRVRWVLDRIGPERLLLGTDATLIDPAVTLGALEAADLSQAERERVMGGNAVELFDLSN